MATIPTPANLAARPRIQLSARPVDPAQYVPVDRPRPQRRRPAAPQPSPGGLTREAFAAAMEAATLGKRQRAVLTVLVSDAFGPAAWPATGSARTTHARIIRDTGMHSAAMLRTLTSLESRGWLRREPATVGSVFHLRIPRYL